MGIKGGACFLVHCAALGCYFDFLPLLDAKAALSLPYLHLFLPCLF